MGAGQSKDQPEMLAEPWRIVNWGGKQDLLRLVRQFKPSSEKVEHVRIMLYGPVGSGKSSYINSVSTAVLERLAIPAAVNAPFDISFTAEYRTHKIMKGELNEPYPFVFNDIMGLGGGTGVRAEDIKLAMKGHVQDGYKFNPYSSLSESNTQFYNPRPSADDRVHLLVCVLSANSPSISDSVLSQMREIREAARDLGIPQVAVATHIDCLREDFNTDVKKVFQYKIPYDKMSEFSSTVGIPMNCIFPVRNYCEKVDNEPDMDTLILTALKHMLDYADDFARML